MARKDVFISGEHAALLGFLVGADKFFVNGYELLAFAASVGWENQRREVPPASAGTGGLTIQMFDDRMDRPDTILADVLAVVRSVSEDEDAPIRAAAELNADRWNSRAVELAAYGHGGLAIIEELKIQHGGYNAALLQLLDSDPVEPAD